MRIAFLIAGVIFVGLALIGAVLPVMPTTIFLILAAGSFARSSPRLEKWLLDHRTLGPPIRGWRENGAISPYGKAMAVGGMTVGYWLFHLTAEPTIAMALVVLTVLGACAAFVLSRPNA
ncbi:MAG TPA: YbaN family protein [Methylomirabilota bacterium]|nr:YbaN family protein [Methylomirabilota bacterium]